jgi:lysophospholipase L1-like esterase
MKRRRIFRVLAILGTLAALAPAARAGDCHAPADLRDGDTTFPRFAARLKQGKPITIVAIGGSATAGAAAPGQAYPQRLQQALARLYPKASIRVLNKGVPHQTAAEELARFPADIIAEKPDLAIWDTGTIEAVRGFDVGAFAATLEDGLALLRSHRIEAVLMDMQYSRRIAAVIDFDPYLNAMQRAADLGGAYFFRRFEIMQYWSDSGAFDFDEVPKADRATLAAAVYDCHGRELAGAIAAAALP